MFSLNLAIIRYGNPAIVLRSFLLDNRRCRLNNRAIIGNISRDGAPRADSDVVADCDFADDFCARADINVVANNRSTRAFAVKERVATDCDVLKNRATLTDFRIFGNKNSVESVRRVEIIQIRIERYARPEITVDIVAFKRGFLFFQRRLCIEMFYKRLKFKCNLFEFDKLIDVGTGFSHRLDETAPDIQHNNTGIFCIVKGFGKCVRKIFLR